MSYTETFQRMMDGDYDGSSDEEKARAIKELIELCSIAAGAVTIQPIPFFDLALISPIQIMMVQAIGRVHGHKLDTKSVVEILSTLGASILAQSVIMAAAKLMPFMGWVVTISMAYALTYAIGEVSDLYFRTGRGVSSDDLRCKFESIYKTKKAEKESANKGNSTLKQKLEELKSAYAEGLLTEDEFAWKKADLLKGF